MKGIPGRLRMSLSKACCSLADSRGINCGSRLRTSCEDRAPNMGTKKLGLLWRRQASLHAVTKSDGGGRSSTSFPSLSLLGGASAKGISSFLSKGKWRKDQLLWLQSMMRPDSMAIGQAHLCVMLGQRAFDDNDTPGKAAIGCSRAA